MNIAALLLFGKDPSITTLDVQIYCVSRHGCYLILFCLVNRGNSPSSSRSELEMGYVFLRKPVVIELLFG